MKNIFASTELMFYTCSIQFGAKHVNCITKIQKLALSYPKGGNKIWFITAQKKLHNYLLTLW
jgi:hypothetical protein